MAERYPGIRLTFFGSHGYMLTELVLRDGRLEPKEDALRDIFEWTSGGKPAIHLDDYDAFVVHGLISLPRILRHLWFNQAFRHDPVAGWGPAFGQLARFDIPALVADTPAVRFLRRAFGDAGKPCLLSPMPGLSEACLDQVDSHSGAPWRVLLGDDGMPVPPVARALERWQDSLVMLGALPQPPETVTRGIFTKNGFSIGSIELSPTMDVAHGEEDFSHMNAAYGETVLPAVIERVCRMVEAGVPRVQDASEPRALHPYRDLPPESHWLRAMPGGRLPAPGSLYRPGYSLGDAAIATAGSCFAQHIGGMLRRGGFRFIDTEPAPPSLPVSRHALYGYGTFSARYGNVYTARQLDQLLARATGDFIPAEEGWQVSGGVVDPFRPTVQPEPFGSVAEMRAARREHLDAVAALFQACDVFVFTLGLTEAWVSAADGAVFPVAPGVAGGRYDPEQHRFARFNFQDVISDLRTFLKRARRIRPGMRLLLSVSPVPLMATASGAHVLTATVQSKSILRAVAGQLADNAPLVDYFPAFEIIGSHVSSARFYGEDKRTVLPAGVEEVMAHFFAAHPPPGVMHADARATLPAADTSIACDEALLAAFGARP